MDDHPDDNENRRARRANLFLPASVDAEGIKASVTIRNFTETGALLEGPALPPVGTLLILKRQGSEIAAEVVWLAAPRCGVRFQGKVSVPEWLAGKRTPLAFGQARVDAIQAAVRSGTPLSGLDAAAGSEEQAAITAEERLAVEISYVQRLLDLVGTELINDPAVVQRHETTLQSFDIADQILGHLARVLTAADREAAIRSIGMEDLRSRLLRNPTSATARAQVGPSIPGAQ